MRAAIHYGDFTPHGATAPIGERLRRAAQAAEDAGFARISLMDHYFQMEQLGGPAEPMLEGYTTLGYLAGLTSRIELGLMVTGVTYRHPGLLAKIVATLDALSEGRAFLGLGAGWYEREHIGLGVPFPPLRERFERLEETIAICRQMWSDDDGPFEGRHYQLEETVCSPPPPHRPEILIGGSGERKTIPLVARAGDACNFVALDADQLAHKISVLRQACAEAERDPSEVRITVLDYDQLDDASAFLRRMEKYSSLGVDLVALRPSSDAERFVDRAGKSVIPALEAL